MTLSLSLPLLRGLSANTASCTEVQANHKVIAGSVAPLKCTICKCVSVTPVLTLVTEHMASEDIKKFVLEQCTK